jgi:hypothetical protein
MVSLELVGEVFEVRTQVDRDLTTVSRVDRRLGLIKNLGRHSSSACNINKVNDNLFELWMKFVHNICVK